MPKKKKKALIDEHEVTVKERQEYFAQPHRGPPRPDHRPLADRINLKVLLEEVHSDLVLINVVDPDHGLSLHHGGHDVAFKKKMEKTHTFKLTLL